VTEKKPLETSKATNQTSGPSAVQHRTASPRHFPKPHAQFIHPYTPLGHSFRFTAVCTGSVSADKYNRHVKTQLCAIRDSTSTRKSPKRPLPSKLSDHSFVFISHLAHRVTSTASSFASALLKATNDDAHSATSLFLYCLYDQLFTHLHKSLYQISQTVRPTNLFFSHVNSRTYISHAESYQILAGR